jgi:alpha-glucosidase
MKKLFFFCLAALALHAVGGAQSPDTFTIKSPAGNIAFHLIESNRQLSFTIQSGPVTVIENSKLEMTINGLPMMSHDRIKKEKLYDINETYEWMGSHSPAVNRCKGANITVGDQYVSYSIEIRVFDDGAAFRIIFSDSRKARTIPDEATAFKLPHGSDIWYHDMNMHYEGVHTRKKIDSVREGEWVAPPATFKIKDGLYASITEADLKNYGGFSLQADGANGLTIRLPQHQPTSYPYHLRYSPEDTLRLMQPASIAGTITTPWRVVMIGDLNALVNCDIVHNLCPPPDKKYFPDGINTDWVKAGRAVWKYLDGGGDGTPEVMKKFTDGAAALGFEHNILEGFWTKWTDDQIRDLVNYSKQKDVGIWLWKHSKNLRDPDSSDLFFRKCHDLGITGAKIDFFDHEAKEEIDLYQRLLKQAASYHILLDFHGANKPTGQSRTWPNELTREAVKGMEARSVTDRATHETVIPFTRCLAGPAEYTVVLFGERRRNTSWAHQIASAAILSAPMLTYAANPENILSNPAVEVIKVIPATWDETIVLPGSEIGQLAAYARRKGSMWFIAVMNGVNEKSMRIPLTFLKPNKTYETIIVKDQPNDPAAVLVEPEKHKTSDIIELKLVGGGGFVAMFTLEAPDKKK